MHLYGIRYHGVRTAGTAPISLTSLPTFGIDELHTLEESICFHVHESKIPQNVRCSCLKDGRFCLVAEHWLLEFDVGSPLWLGEDGLSRAGSLIRYVGPKHGGKSVIIDKFGERVCCIEGLTSQDVMGGDGSSMQTG